MSAPYAAEQTSKLPGDVAPGEYVYSGSQWVPVDRVEVHDGVAVIHLAPIQCAADEPIAVCTAG